MTYFPILIIKKEIKEKKIEKKIYIDLAVRASQWFEVANYNIKYIRDVKATRCKVNKRY